MVAPMFALPQNTEPELEEFARWVAKPENRETYEKIIGNRTDKAN